MPYFYSPATGGFYLPEIHGEAIPGDAVEISDEDHAALMTGQAEGRPIVAGEGGVPEIGDLPPPRRIRVIRALAFRLRLSDSRRAAVTAAAVAAAPLDGGAALTFLLDQAAGASTDLDDPRVTDGVAAMEAAGVITAEEAEALLADGVAEEAASG